MPILNCQALTPHTKCRLWLLKLERVKEYLLRKEELVSNQERHKPQEEKVEEESMLEPGEGLLLYFRKERSWL